MTLLEASILQSESWVLFKTFPTIPSYMSRKLCWEWLGGHSKTMWTRFWPFLTTHLPHVDRYSPVRMKFNRNNISFNFWGRTKTIEKCNIPLKSPIKWLPKMQHFFLNSNFCYVFRAIFGKLMFLKNGHGRHEMGGMPTHYVFIFHEFQWGSFAESFTQKYSLVSKLQNSAFSKMALKT